jgi:hypothetical protein
MAFLDDHGTTLFHTKDVRVLENLILQTQVIIAFILFGLFLAEVVWPDHSPQTELGAIMIQISN